MTIYYVVKDVKMFKQLRSSVADFCNDTCHPLTSGHRVDESVRLNNVNVLCMFSLAVVITTHYSCKGS